jgi:hypothetical protein
MKKKNIILIIAVVVIIVVIPIAWWLGSPLFLNKTVDEGIPTEGNNGEESSLILLYSGNFKDADDFHKAEGAAEVIEIDSKKYLRFEDFSSTNVPDAHVYLSKDLKANDFIDIGELKGNIGNQNYEISDNIDLEEYDKVLIWCVPFRVLVGSAELEKLNN